MRVLVTSVSAVGHVLPMVPVAAALQAGGHDVIWATGADTGEWVRRAGLVHMPAGLSERALTRQLWQGRQSLQRLAPEAVPDVLFGMLFGEHAAPAMLADLRSLVRDWTPELVLHDAAEFAGPIVAASAGAPNVVTSFGPLLPRPRVAGAGKAVAPLWHASGLTPRPFGGCYDHLYLDIYPPVLQPRLPAYIPRRQWLRPVHAGLANARAVRRHVPGRRSPQAVGVRDDGHGVQRARGPAPGRRRGRGTRRPGSGHRRPGWGCGRARRAATPRTSRALRPAAGDPGRLRRRRVTRGIGNSSGRARLWHPAAVSAPGRRSVPQRGRGQRRGCRPGAPARRGRCRRHSGECRAPAHRRELPHPRAGRRWIDSGDAWSRHRRPCSGATARTGSDNLRITPSVG